MLFLLLTAHMLPTHAQSVSFDHFENKIRPVLVEHCYECHSVNSKEIAGGLRLDSREGIAQGGDSGPVLNATQLANSLLLKALRYEGPNMPPNRKLPNDTVVAFEEWIKSGAPDPRTAPHTPTASLAWDWDQARKFWAFQPRSKPIVPEMDTLGSANSGLQSLDAFIQSEYASKKLTPNPPADRNTWLRRVSIDLLGHPPSLDEIKSFEANTDPDAYEQVVDRMLASPAYGRRWGRHWLDLARYADSNGADENHRYPVAWRYRDYVIQAMNEDVPYDQFLKEQLAGDLLPAANEAEQRRLLTATGFLVIGPKMLAEQDKPKLVADLVDEQIDTVGKSLLGLTLGCARCHDHKFDPILTNDYYALAGIFHSTKSMEHLNFVSQWNERLLPDTEQSQRIADAEARRDAAKKDFLVLENKLRWQALSSQLHDLLSAMHWHVASRTPSFNSNTRPKNWELWADRWHPTKVVGKSDYLFAWKRLQNVPHEQFELEAGKLWNDLANTEIKPGDWLGHLRSAPAPKSHWDLINIYSGLTTKLLLGLSGAARGADGKFTNPEMQRLYQQLVVKSEYFAGFDKFVDSASESDKERYQREKANIEALEKAIPAAPKAMAVQEAGSVKLVSVHVRGNHLQTKGPPLERSIPRVFEDPDHPTALPIRGDSSGRLELAQWIANEQNPLTARVIVNRIWQVHFGTGIVASSSNFGLRGSPPSHPKLLDWLANEFIRSGWSMKWLHRQIVLSQAYRMSSHTNPEMAAIDPENRWLWRQNKRRMEAETLRDSLLMLGDAFDQTMGGEPQSIQSVQHPTFPGASHFGNMRPTIYLEINRAALHDFLATFDYVEPGVSVDRRSSTIVPHQALFLMNNPLPQEAGKRLAENLISASSSDSLRLTLATYHILGRAPSSEEREIVISRLPSSGARLEDWVTICRSLLLTNEFLYVD
jgi:hypothetical protein